MWVVLRILNTDTILCNRGEKYQPVLGQNLLTRYHLPTFEMHECKMVVPQLSVLDMPLPIVLHPLASKSLLYLHGKCTCMHYNNITRSVQHMYTVVQTSLSRY